MRLKWGEEEYRYFNKKIPVVERESWLTELIDKYYWWAVLACLIVANIWIWYLNYQTYIIRAFVKSI